MQMVYVFDGTEQGFYTAFLAAYHDEYALLSSRQLQLPLGYEPKFIQTDEKKAEKAKQRIAQFDKQALSEIRLLLRCGEEDSEQAAFEYLKEITKAKCPIRGKLQNLAVFEAVEKLKRVRYEIHRFHGFIRFTQTASGALYAPFSPDNDICDLLVPHFKARLPKCAFVLHDVQRKKAAIYDGENVFISTLVSADVILSADEDGWQELWKEYYQAVHIPSRERLSQMRGYMPKRYWKFLTETETIAAIKTPTTGEI